MSVACHLESLDLVLRDEMLSLAADAVAMCRRGKLEDGFSSLRLVESQTAYPEDLSGAFFTYLGLGNALFENDYSEAVRLCERGIELAPTESEAYVSLVRVHNRFGSRESALNTVRDGLQTSSSSYELIAFRRQMGVRRPPVIPGLSRDHRLNRTFGKWRHKLRARLGG